MKALLALTVAAVGVLVVRKRAGKDRIDVWHHATDR